VYHIANKTVVTFEVLTVVKLYIVESNILAMPWRCAVCKMVGGKEYSLHLLPKIIEIQGG